MAVESISGNLSTTGRLSANLAAGGGSDVSITPTYNSGVKIADFIIDGTSGVIYVPTVKKTYSKLWENTNGVPAGTYSLLDSIDNYDELELYIGVYNEYTSAPNLMRPIIITVDSCNFAHANGKQLLSTGYENRAVYYELYGNTFKINLIQYDTILMINGIKYHL